MNNKKEIRTLHEKPLGRVILIDLAENKSLLDNISTSLIEYFTLCNNLISVSNTELFGLYVIHEFAECLIPLQRLKINLQNIVNIIPNIHDGKRKFHCIKEDFQEHFSASLTEVCAQLQQSLKNSTKIVSPGSQLDVCLITSQHQRSIEKQVAEAIKELDLKLIKKVQIVHVNSNELTTELKCSNESDGSIDSATNEIICEYIETVYIENNVVSFEQHFRSWLKDGGSDDVHMFIDFSSSPTTEGIELKCDLVDAILNPLLINGGKQLLIETELNHFQQKSSTKLKSLNVYRLEPRSLVRLDGICESVLHGSPILVKPTGCWKLDWEELESNQNVFANVCIYLQREHLGLLLERSCSSPQPIKSYFILLPSSATSMLLKSIASRDIMMPYEKEIVASLKSHVVNEEVENQLKKIEIVESYNPFNYACGIFSKSNFPAETQKKIHPNPIEVKKHSTKKLNPFHSGFVEETASTSIQVASYPLRKPQLHPENLKRPSTKYVPSFQRNPTMKHGQNFATHSKHGQASATLNKRMKPLFSFKENFPNEL